MIDTDKYEGYTPAPWSVEYPISPTSEPNRKLIADAPLLLEEIERLNRFAHCAMNFMSKHDLHYQFLNEYGVYTSPNGGSISMFIPYSYKWDDETKVSSEPIQFNIRGEEE